MGTPQVGGAVYQNPKEKQKFIELIPIFDLITKKMIPYK